MPLYALENLDDAFDASKAMLWPFDLRRWLKLALVVFFIGGPGASFNTPQYNVPAEGGPRGELPFPELGPRAWLAIAAVVAAVLLLVLLFMIVGSIMEFVFVESLRTEEVRLREYWGRRWRQGLRLFGFRLVFGLIVLGSVAALAALFLLPVAAGIGPTGGLSVLALLLVVPVVLVLAILVGLINGFTTVFVVPVMILDDCGVLAGWRRLWPTITDQPWQYLAYAVAGFVLSIAAGIVVAIAAGVSILVLLIPFGILGAIGFFLLSVVQLVGIGVLVVVGVAFAIVALAVLALVQVPVKTYLRYYALLVLGDVDDELDIIPDRREAVRSGE